VDNEILRKAVFLLRECHEPPQQAVEGLKNYFPYLAPGDRERYVSEAMDMMHGTHSAVL
jgi:hypothetical protein